MKPADEALRHYYNRDPEALVRFVNQIIRDHPMKKDVILSIARVCHEVNKAYCEALGDPTQPTWEDAPNWQRSSAYEGVEMHLKNPDITPEQSHAAWMESKLKAGWTYGPVKDPNAKTHPCLVPFAELPEAQRAKDYLFRGTVHAIAREMART